MTTVHWNVIHPKLEELDNWFAVAHQEPESVLQYILKNRGVDNDKSYVRCPAFLDFYRNMYVIKSPMDIKITYNRDKKFLSVSPPQNQNFYDNFVLAREFQTAQGDPFLMSLVFTYLFIADKECLIEVLPVIYHDNSVSSKIRVICGTYDISKWFRPIEFGFEMLSEDEPLVIKRGDPLYYIRFIPKEGKVTLKKEAFGKDVYQSIRACSDLKNVLPKQPLKIMYELASKIKPKFKKCPFLWGKK